MLRVLLPVLVAVAASLPCQSFEHGWSLQRTRAVWFGEQRPIEAEVGLSFESRPWDDAANTAWTAPPGTRLALATRTWAEFATFTELQFGGTRINDGSYYAVLERTRDGMVLGLLDAPKVRARQLGPGIAEGQPLVAAIPMSVHEGPDGPLRAEFVPDQGGETVSLQLQWGTHVLSATARVQDGKGNLPVAMPDPRLASRVSWLVPAGPMPMAVVDHGVLPWNEEWNDHADALEIGQRWRLGRDWATTLDTNTPLTIGGKRLGAGLWHLTMEKAAAGWNLAFSDAVEDYAGRLDGYAADEVRPVLVVPLQTDTERIKTADLMVLFQTRERQMRLVITAAGQQLFVPVELGG